MNTKKKISPREKANWNDILPILLSIISLVISAISIYQSYKAQQFVQQESIRQYSAIAVPSYYIAQSPDLKSDYDTKTLGNLCSQRSLLTTDYWRQTEAASFDNKTRYLFLIIKNQGPGPLTDFYFSELDWKPKVNAANPNVLAGIESVRSSLAKGECLSLLVDVLGSYDVSKKLADQVDINFTDIVFRETYKDLLGNVYNPPKISIINESVTSVELTR